MAEQEIVSDSADWFNLSAEDQSAVIDLDFDETVAQTDVYQQADEAAQADYRQAHRMTVEEAALNSRHNPANIEGRQDQSQANRAGWVKNTLTKVGESHTNAAARATMVDDSINPDGSVDDDFAQQASLYYQKQQNQITTREEKRLAAAITKLTKATERDGFLNDTLAWAEFIFKDLPQNLTGVMHVAADSASSITTMGAGGLTGAKVGGAVGTVVPGIGNVAGATVGGATGMIAASIADAGSSKFLEELRTAMTEQDLALTPTNIKMFLDHNSDAIQAMQKKSAQYGGILGIVDVALGGFASKLATLPTRAARQSAIRSMDDASRAMLSEVAQKSGKSLDDLTEDLINVRTRETLDARGFKAKLKDKGTSLTGEVISEPASEAAATAGVGDEVKLEDLLYETLGGIGAGPYGAAVNTAVLGTKVAADKTGEFKKKILATPEQKAVVAEQKTQQKVAKEQQRSEAAFQFKKDVEAADPTDHAEIDRIASPKGENNPVKAAAILAKQDDVASIDKLKEVETNFKADFLQNLERYYELDDKKAAGEELTVEETQEIGHLQKLVTTQEQTFQKLQEYSARAAEKATQSREQKEVQPLDAEKATQTSITEQVTESFGSHGTVTNETIDSLLQRDDLIPEQQEMLSAMKEANASREALESKNLNQVRHDIYHGIRGSEFKGVDAYKQAISHYLHPEINDQANAQKQLEGLQRFRDAHQLKAQRFTELHTALVEGKAWTSQQRQMYALMQADNKNLTIHKGSGRLVAAVQQEADALGKEVALAESLFKARDAQTKVKPVSTKPTSFPSEAEHLEGSLAAKLEKGGVDPKLKEELLEERRQMTREPDRVTGLIKNDFFGPTMKRAWKDATDTKRNFAYAVADLRNLGGLNKHFGGESNADPAFKAMAQIIQQKVTAAFPGAQVFRKGGDEFAVLAPEVSQADLAAVMEQASAEIDAWVKQEGLDQLAHPKGGAPGTGIYHATVGFDEVTSLQNLENVADAIQAKMKVSLERTHNESIKTAAEAGTQSSGEGSSETGEGSGQSDSKEQPSAERTKDSTVDGTVDIVQDNLAEYENKDFGELDVEYQAASGETVTRPYNEAIEELNTDIREANEILKCCKAA